VFVYQITSFDLSGTMHHSRRRFKNGLASCPTLQTF